MSKHLRGFCKDGTTFGMEVDGKRSVAVMRKAEKIRSVNSFGYERTESCLRSADVASLMGSVAWLITEKQDFTHVQIDDSIKYRIIYPEQDDARKMAQFLGKKLLHRR